MMLDKSCKTCAWWVRLRVTDSVGTCNSVAHRKGIPAARRIELCTVESLAPVELITGPDFGCVNYEMGCVDSRKAWDRDFLRLLGFVRSMSVASADDLVLWGRDGLHVGVYFDADVPRWVVRGDDIPDHSLPKTRNDVLALINKLGVKLS